MIFAKLFTIDNKDQVLYIKEDDANDDMPIIVIMTHINGGSIRISLGFKSVRLRDQEFEKVDHASALLYYKSLPVTLFTGKAKIKKYNKKSNKTGKKGVKSEESTKIENDGNPLQ